MKNEMEISEKEEIKYDWLDSIKAQRNAKFEIKGKIKTM